MGRLNGFGAVTVSTVLDVAKQFGTPAYLYDEGLIIEKCTSLKEMPNAFGLAVRYAMKANSSKSVLKLINDQGLLIDASSMNEVRRAFLAGVKYPDIILTTQEVPVGEQRQELEDMIKRGLKYNVCSLRQLRLIGDFAVQHHVRLAIRISPGIGSGETATRNTGDKYSCFGIHLNDVGDAVRDSRERGLIFDHIHVHIGSGGDPEIWRRNIDLEMEILEKYFPDAETVSFGGGLKEARMPGETSADIQSLGNYARMRLEDFFQRTGRRLKMEIEPGTYVVANAGYAVTQVIDKKETGSEGFRFIVADGGMEINARPLLYASEHPFYIISQTGELLSSEFFPERPADFYEAVVVGKCCESGDSQCLSEEGLNTPRKIAEPGIGDYVVIGGVGAYCSAMTPMNYNSHTQVPEVMLLRDGSLREIRRRQSLEQMLENERF